jgi:hypothetical protein
MDALQKSLGADILANVDIIGNINSMTFLTWDGEELRI